MLDRIEALRCPAPAKTINKGIHAAMRGDIAGQEQARADAHVEPALVHQNPGVQTGGQRRAGGDVTVAVLQCVKVHQQPGHFGRWSVLGQLLRQER